MNLKSEHIAEIQNRYSRLKNKEDLLNLLNKIGSHIYGEKAYNIDIKQLTYYANPIHCKDRYRTFQIQKKSGGERIIHSPAHELNRILFLVNLMFSCCGKPHRKAFGFVKGKSIADNASLHLDREYVYNLDLKDFFYSFNRKRVKSVLLREPFNLNDKKEPVAFLIACLCTHPLEIEGETRIVLPQGSPTSPLLTNFLCETLDRRLNGLAKKFGARYSRYADDISFSSHRNIFSKAAFQEELTRIIEVDQKLKINPDKTRLQKSAFRQEVTGLTVNKKVNVHPRYIKQIRMWIYYWERYGYYRAKELFTKDYKADKGHANQFVPPLKNVLEGPSVYSINSVKLNP